MIVSKTLKFEAGHRLAFGYPGNCQHAHGHSYIVTVVMEATTDDLDKFGFVKDFNDFKPLKQWIDDKWDHAFLVAQNDTPMLTFLRENKQRHFIFDSNPTAENIARELFIVAEELLNDGGATVTEVRVNETATSEAVYRSTLVQDALDARRLLTAAKA